jgi:hypothetical protein
MSDFNWTTTPAEFLREIGAVFKKRGKWLQISSCPFCGGGGSSDKYSLNVHETDGNFFCHRSKCGMRGSFWKFIELNNRDPKDYLSERRKSTKKRYIFGKYE